MLFFFNLMICFVDVIEKDNFILVKRLIKEFGGWFVLSVDWKEDMFNLIGFLEKVRFYMNSLFLMDMYVYDDLKNLIRNIFYVRNSIDVCFIILMEVLFFLGFLKIKYIYVNY